MPSFEVYMQCLRTLERGESLTSRQLDELPTLIADSSGISGVAVAELAGDVGLQHRLFMTAIPSPQVLYDYLDWSLDYMITRNEDHLPPPGSRGRLYGWNWGYAGRALLYGYDATGDEKFLTLFIETFDRLLELRDDARDLVDEAKGSVLPGWGVGLENGLRANEVTTVGLMALPVCELLLRLRHSADLRQRYEGLFERYLGAIAPTFALFDEDFRRPETEPGGYFVVPGTEDPEALNHTHLLAAAAVLLEAVTDEVPPDWLEDTRAWFRAHIVEEDNGTWSWEYCPKPGATSPGRAEAVWKAGVTIELPIAAARVGRHFDPIEFDAVVDTFLENVVMPDGRINRWISSQLRGEITSDLDMSPSLPGVASTWLLCGDRRPEAVTAFLKLMACNPSLFPGGWLWGAKHMLMGVGWLLAHSVGRVDPFRPDAMETGQPPAAVPSS